MPKTTIDIERCKGCERCNDACPQQILGMSEGFNAKGYPYAVCRDPGRCIGCRLCAITCPDVAIAIWVEGSQYELFSY